VRDRGGWGSYPWPVTATSPEWPLPGDPDASVGARHHRVPRFYLERFANERMQIATVDRRTRARRTAAIRETAAEKDFYTAISTEGAKDGKTEHLLSHIEGNAARAIKNILNPVLPLSPHGSKTAPTCACSLPSRRCAAS
jgi:hypothetical protein